MQKLFGGILMGCGILVAGVSGLCMLMIGLSFFGEFGSDGGASELFSMIGLLLIYAGIPIAIGVGLFLLGRHVIRQADNQTETSKDHSDTFK